MSASAPPLDEEHLRARLTSRWLGHRVHHFTSCGSTNDEAALLARGGAPHGTVVIAESQTSGRGRLRRVWHSPPGLNLYFSTVLRPAIAPHRAPPLTLAAAVAVVEAVEDQGARPELKWPNDLLLDGKKLAGILTEMVTTGTRIEFVVIGIGVNLNAGHLGEGAFPVELADRANSLALSLGRPIDRAAFTAKLCERLEHWHDRLVAAGPAEIVGEWKRRAAMLGKTITVTSGNEVFAGVAEDVDDEGALVLRESNGAARRILAGEIA